MRIELSSIGLLFQLANHVILLKLSFIEFDTQVDYINYCFLNVYPPENWVWTLCGVVANVLNYDIVLSEFELQSRYNIRFRINTLGKGMTSLIPSAMG